MRYTITGRNIDVTPGLRAAIETASRSSSCGDGMRTPRLTLYTVTCSTPVPVPTIITTRILRQMR